MKKNLFARIFALLLALTMFASFAVAEEAEEITDEDLIALFGLEETDLEEVEEEITAEVINDFSQRGVVFSFTDEDIANGFTVSPNMYTSNEVNQLPVFSMCYFDMIGLEKTISSFSEEDLESEEGFLAVFEAFFSHNYEFFTTALFEKEYYDAKVAEGLTAADLIGVEDAFVLGENDGYVYISWKSWQGIETDDEALLERLNAAAVRLEEVLKSATFQPIEFAPGEILVAPDNFPTFSSVDLDGNPVTSDIFAEKDLTVVNIWGTFCGPCIGEMPELAEWDEALPENVQIIGIVCDLYDLEDTEILQAAKDIYADTGVTFTSVVTSDELFDFLMDYPSVPTTFFVDKTGACVGEPISGARVDAYKQFVEEYLAAL